MKYLFLALFSLIGCVHPMSQPKSSQVVYGQCVQNTGLVVLLIDDAGNGTPYYGPLGCRCAVTVDGRELIDVNPATDAQCNSSTKQ